MAGALLVEHARNASEGPALEHELSQALDERDIYAGLLLLRGLLWMLKNPLWCVCDGLHAELLRCKAIDRRS